MRRVLTIALLPLLPACLGMEKEEEKDLDITKVPERIALVLVNNALPIVDLGAQPIGTTTDATVTLVNKGVTSALTIGESRKTKLEAPFAWKGGKYPGEGGTCGSTELAQGATCTVVVSFAPTKEGSFAGTAGVEYDNGVLLAPLSIPLLGSTPASIEISESPAYTYGVKSISTSTEKTLTLTNSGGAPARLLDENPKDKLEAPFSWKGGTFPGSGGTCSKILNGEGKSCSVVVMFEPSKAGVYQEKVSLAFHDGKAAQVVARDIDGSTPAVLAVSDVPTYDFGTRSVSSATDKTLTITNSGGTSATAIADAASLSGPFAYKGGKYPGTGGTCASTLAGGSTTCTVVLAFGPTSITTATGKAKWTYNDGTATQSISLDLKGATPAVLALSDGETFDFGIVAVGSSTDKAFTLTNSGGAPATSIVEDSTDPLAAPLGWKGGAYPGTGGTCGVTLAAGGASCTVVVTYNPGVAGVHADSIRLQHSDGTASQVATRALAGKTKATLSISDGPTFAFGVKDVATSTDKTLTVSNGGGNPATAMGAGAPPLAAPFSFKGGAYPGTGGTCAASLNGGGATCTLVVTFNPAAHGSWSDTVRVDFNDGVSPQTASLAVTGATPAVLALSGGEPTAYPVTNLAATSDISYTISNTGGSAATSLQASIGTPLGAPFAYPGTSWPGGGDCTATLPAGASCTVITRFAPVASGAFSTTMAFTFHDGAAAQSLTRTLTGNTPALLSLSDGPTYSFGSKALGTSTDKTITVTNSGGAQATAMGAGAPAMVAPYAWKGGAYPGAGGNCGATLSGSGATCTVVVNYSPTANGNLTDTARISYNDGLAAQVSSVGVSGTGYTPAQLSLSAAPTLDFGRRANTVLTDLTVTVSHVTGNVNAVSASDSTPASLAAPFSFVGGSYPGTGGSCTASIGVGASCTLKVRFAPTANASYSGSLTIRYDDSGGVAGVNQSAIRDVAGVGQSGWNNLAANALAGRMGAVSVWTGTDLIVFGGMQAPATKYGDGARYNPVADSWTALPGAGAPSARSHTTAVWASNAATARMIVWGGLNTNDAAALSDGAMYDPVANSWVAISAAGAPAARYGHTAVWDTVNKKMIVWGGADNAGVLGAGLGFTFDPDNGANGTWGAIADGLPSTPAGRYEHVAAWTGTKMIVWGGCAGKNAQTSSCSSGANHVNTGAIYDPAGSWTTMTTVGAPTGRFRAAAAQVNGKFVVWGGGTDQNFDAVTINPVDTGGIYTEAPEGWVATAAGAPNARSRHILVSDGVNAFVWGGLEGTSSGAKLSVPGNVWTAFPGGGHTDNFWATGAHTGPDQRFLVFGGRGPGPVYSNAGRLLAP